MFALAKKRFFLVRVKCQYTSPKRYRIKIRIKIKLYFNPSGLYKSHPKTKNVLLQTLMVCPDIYIFLFLHWIKSANINFRLPIIF